MRLGVCASSDGDGNVRSVLRALAEAARGAGRDVSIALAARPEDVRRMDAVVVPGQGSFGAFVATMRDGLGEALADRIRAGAPYLGICLGLQVLFEESDEAPGERGLGVLRGRVRRLDPGIDAATGRPWPLPHVGWNVVSPSATAPPSLAPDATHFYFAHSYAAVPDDPAVVAATTDYGRPFVSAVAQGSVLGVQFHPEKSQRAGLALLERFLSL